jgi:hypothetical protein
MSDHRQGWGRFRGWAARREWWVDAAKEDVRWRAFARRLRFNLFQGLVRPLPFENLNPGEGVCHWTLSAREVLHTVWT